LRYAANSTATVPQLVGSEQFSAFWEILGMAHLGFCPQLQWSKTQAFFASVDQAARVCVYVSVLMQIVTVELQ
jgi:hypothetical protein